MPSPTPLFGVALAGLLIAVATDVARNKIYNWLTLPLFLLGLALQFLTRGVIGVGYSFAGALAVLVVLFLLFSFLGQGLGGGDIKLLIALGAVLGWPLTGWLLLYTALCGAVVAIPVMVRRGILAYSVQNMTLNFMRRRMGEKDLSLSAHSKAPRLPFAVSVLLGMILLLLWGPLR